MPRLREDEEAAERLEELRIGQILGDEGVLTRPQVRREVEVFVAGLAGIGVRLPEEQAGGLGGGFAAAEAVFAAEAEGGR